MNQLSFVGTYRTSPYILTEGAVVERLRREFHIPLDEDLIHAALIYNTSYREVLAGIYKQYIDIAARYQLPLMLMTPTRRANAERISGSVYRNRDILRDNVAFLSELRDTASTPIYIGGLAGCRGDAYDGRYHLSVEEATQFHYPTVRALAEAGADYLFAGIMPQLTETIGMANAMAATGLPYIISFMIRRDGRLLDGSFIHDAIDTIDKEATTRPLCYMANCVHPDVLHQALSHSHNDTPLVRERFQGLQANASTLTPEELEGRTDLESSSPDELADRLMTLLWDFPLKICGGCCGTDERHLNSFAEILTQR
ncbi:MULTISPECIES: homocysteine S-methyltransferase family protein [Bacteroides]|uniref:homocysteine S-methyltransferase family protein n=1 Tax=Bacteroides TaxID=816 RepID=UPI00259CC18E|nr:MULTISPECIES: homocysteine S-methyltransferase family protein [Bacteroides]